MNYHLPMKMELIEGTETSAIRTQTLENYPKENILTIEHGESLKSRIGLLCLLLPGGRHFITSFGNLLSSIL